jgi:hypothetical protein
MLLGDPLNLFAADDDDNFGLDDILDDSDTDSVDLPYLESLRRQRLSTGRSCAAVSSKRPVREKAALLRLPTSVAADSSSESDEVNEAAECDGEDVDFDVSEGAPNSTGQRKSVGSASSSGERPMKRGRASLRDVQLGKAVSDSCMQVAERTAELRDATAVKVCATNVACRDRMMLVAEREGGQGGAS